MQVCAQYECWRQKVTGVRLFPKGKLHVCRYILLDVLVCNMNYSQLADGPTRRRQLADV